MKDVKSYVQTIAKRLGSAFSLEDFEMEDELEFWALAAEYLSRDDQPEFREIAEWMDILYRAPVHFVYLNDGNGRVKLEHRSVLIENVERKFTLNELSGKERKEKVTQFEKRLDNLENRITVNEEMKQMGGAAFPIGHCHRIPLFKGDSFQGMYCTGPYVENPSGIIPRLSIIGRILSKWLAKKEENSTRENSITNVAGKQELSSFDSKSFDIGGYVDVLLGHLTSVGKANSAAMVKIDKGAVVVGKVNLDGELGEAIKKYEGNPGNVEEFSSYLKAQYTVARDDLIVEPLETITADAYMVTTVPQSEKESLNESQAYKGIIDTLLQLLRYQDQNKHITELITETYYRMLREIEQQRDKTAFHTDRMVALCDRFADYFGMDANERDDIICTAKLHDIGYLSLFHQERKRTVGSDIEHPLLGYKLVQNLALDDNIKKGIRTHHEWIDGSGTPEGVSGEEIAWTGKIIGLFEFVVQYIETHRNIEPSEGDNVMGELTSALIERADIQFEMMLIPTVVEMLNDMSWDELCELGEG